MDFKSYGEIENTYNQKIINKIYDFEFPAKEPKWYCFTKIDGSNFQCSIDEEDKFIVGTRSHYLGRDSDFQGYERAMRNEDVENKLRKMKDLIFDNFYKDYQFKGVKTKSEFCLTVYGELCGGMYRHPDVEKVKGATKIQGRVDYHPDNMWVPFDILLRQIDGNVFLCPQEMTIKACERVGLPHEPIKFIGSFEDCLNFPIDFVDTTGHDLWGLPIIEKNISEGIVIKPNHGYWFPTGQRVILKKKGERFKERIEKNREKNLQDLTLNELEQKYCNIYREYITESRLYSVFSKIGEVNEKSFGTILGMFMKDLYNDFEKDYSEETHKLECELSVDELNLSKVRKIIAKEVTEFIRPMFIKKLNGIE